MSGDEFGGQPPRFLGIDLGWSSGATGLAVVDDDGRLLNSTRVRTDDEISDWVTAHAAGLVVAAVDAPLIVPNPMGQREPERLIGQAFGGFGASAHTTNQNKFGGEEPRAMRLARRLGWTVDPHAQAGLRDGLCIEVYPHPAMVGLFQLGYRLDYKKGNDLRRSPGFAALAAHLESIPELKLGSSQRWAEMRATLETPAPGDLNRLEDEMDAVLCAHLAWLWQHRRDSLHVYGSVESGYIVAPPPPTHRPVRPVKAAGTPSEEASKAFERAVAGRPTGYSAGDHERRWKQAVRAAFAECSLPAGGVTVEAHFRLAPEHADAMSRISTT